ncbi:MAG: pre-peptidase C-terminal domain-containing protein [Chloroflexota bacterium]
MSGTLNDATPQAIYAFTGLRGDVISIDLSVISGDLDPMLSLIDSSGSVIALSDDGSLSGRGSRDLRLASLHLPHSDQYSLIVARFGYLLGTTSGAFSLTVDRIGVSSASGSALRYGDSVYNTITDSNPQVYYSFRAARGDVISVRMQRASGDLDPALLLVNGLSQIVADNDDSPGSLDAAINGFIIREDGVYALIASRFGQAAGRSKGAFVLTLVSGSESGLGRTVEFALPILPGVAAQGEISENNSVRFYSFVGKRDDVVNIRMSRVGGALDTFVALLDPSQREIVSDDDGGGGQNSLIGGYVLPRDGTYTIVATRFERAEGTTVGAYQLQLDVSGSVFATVQTDVTRLEYGTTVSGAISDAAPGVLYAFVGQQGDVITVAMNRVDGNLDSRVAILNADQNPLTSDDDGGGGQNARIESFTIGSTGVYYLLATRYNGTQGDANTSGTYTLTLAEVPN